MKKIISYLLILILFAGSLPQDVLAVTRFYLTNAPEDKTLPSVKGTWTNSANSLTRLLRASKTGSSATIASPTSSATGDNMMIARWQTLPLSADTSFSSNTVGYALGAVLSSGTNTTFVTRVHIFVIEPDGATVRGTLLTNHNGTATWPTVAAGVSDTAISLTNVSAKAGDRIVVEIGYSRSGSSNSNRTGTANYGNPTGTDQSQGGTATNPGWVEFNNTFTTASSTAPTVTTQSATSITKTTAVFNGNMTANNGAWATVRGFAWGTNSGLNGGDTATTTDTAGQPFDIGAFTDSSETLVCGTTYYYRPYATNANGDGLGTISSSFTTTACDPPTVSTDFASKLGGNYATLNGDKTGGDNATQSGFAYSTDINMTSGVSTTTLGAVNGNIAFSGQVTSLSADTTYYVRAYATNSGGTGLGIIRSFFTGDSNVKRIMQLFNGARIKVIGSRLKIMQK